MKLRQNSTRPRIFEGSEYEHPWYKYEATHLLNKPNPPSKEAIEKAKFVDKTYHWSGTNNLRSGNQRTTK